MLNRLFPLALLCLALSVLTLVPADRLRADEPKAATPSLVVGNAEGKRRPCPPKAWQALPRRTVEIKETGGKAVRYEGVLLAEVLRFGGVPFGKHPRGERTAAFVLVEAADGYRTVLALAEVYPALTDHVVLLADRRDGQLLTESSGPYRLIVPQDKLHSRWVKRVVRVTVHAALRQADDPKK